MPQPLLAALAGERLRIVAGLIRVTGDWDLAEDCVQDAVERALVRWPRDGTPDNPAAWLTTTAHRRAIDVLRRRRVEAAKLAELTREPAGGGSHDDELSLLFTCCHPALPLAGRVALTLRTVAGLSTREIARAFLVSEATMGQRLLRTRNRIAHTGIALRVPEPHRRAERTAGVLAVVYLLFNEGWSDGREELAARAVWLAGELTRLLPDDDEVHGLHALVLLQHARRATRTDRAGDLVPMAEQDRGRWDRDMIAAGLRSLRPSAGPYQLQARIAAAHATAPHADATDWPAIVALYDRLLAVQPSPVVRLNRAVAVGFRDGPAAGLAAVDEVGPLPGYHLLPATRADLLRRAGEPAAALAAYSEALAGARSDAERRFLRRRITELG